MNSIFTRRSIRKYTEQMVEKDKIYLLLKAGMSAPTACNQREWEFIVVTDKKLLQQLAHVSPYAAPVGRAPLAIVPLANEDCMGHPKFFEQDLGAACENILIEAKELELGAVWLGVAPESGRMENVSKVLGLPGNVKPFAILAIGYPDEERKQEERFDERKVHYDGY